MKKFSNVLWGLALISVGVIIGLNSFGITDIDLFFEGWWTLFIIVPSFIGLLTQREKTGNAIALCIGVFLLLSVRDVISFDMLWKLAVPAIIVIIGLKMVFAGIFGNKTPEQVRRIKESREGLKGATATFSGSDINFDGEIFYGTDLNAIFGGIKCDLRQAIIDQDCVINASAIFGGVDIFIPEGVNVKIYSNSIFGGVSESKHAPSKGHPHTLYINATCMFGGVEIK